MLWLSLGGIALNALLTTSSPQVAAHADEVLVLAGGRIRTVVERPTVTAITEAAKAERGALAP